MGTRSRWPIAEARRAAGALPGDGHAAFAVDVVDERSVEALFDAVPQTGALTGLRYAPPMRPDYSQRPSGAQLLRDLDVRVLRRRRAQYRSIAMARARSKYGRQ